MSDLIKVIILGVIEGLTEFLPVSSTGHLILAEDFLNFHSGNAETFSIAIQLGAIAAVVWLYWDFFKTYLQLRTWLNRSSFIILTAISPALLLGLLFYTQIKGLFSPFVVIISLGVGALIMLFVEKIYRPIPNTKDIADVTFKQAFVIGLCQCVSLVPGMSRSGSTIVGGLIAKLDYKTSAKFSFIIAVPVMVAAVSFDLIQGSESLTTHDWLLIAVGFVVSFSVAMAAILTFIKLLSTLKLAPFAWYRIGLSVLLSIVYLI